MFSVIYICAGAGVVANTTAGPAVCLSFVVGGVCALLSSFVYSEVGSLKTPRLL